jgi:hypothetical protein
MTTSATPLDVQDEIQHEIITNELDPFVVRKRVQAYLADLSLDDETMGAVLHEARLTARARNDEFRRCDGDMERVVAVMDGAIEPMIAWLEANGLPDARRHVFGRGRWWSDRCGMYRDRQ